VAWTNNTTYSHSIYLKQSELGVTTLSVVFGFQSGNSNPSLLCIERLMLGKFLFYFIELQMWVAFKTKSLSFSVE